MKRKISRQNMTGGKSKAGGLVETNLLVDARLRVAHELDSLTAMPCDSERRFSEVKARYTNLQSSAEESMRVFLKELRVGVAERLVYAAIAAALPIVEVKRFFNRLARLGFHDAAREFEMRLVFCRYLIHMGNLNQAARILKTLRTKCQRLRVKARSAGGVLPDNSTTAVWEAMEETISVLLSHCST
jgi:hypothetical protein